MNAHDVITRLGIPREVADATQLASFCVVLVQGGLMPADWLIAAVKQANQTDSPRTTFVANVREWLRQNPPKVETLGVGTGLHCMQLTPLKRFNAVALSPSPN